MPSAAIVNAGHSFFQRAEVAINCTSNDSVVKSLSQSVAGLFDERSSVPRSKPFAARADLERRRDPRYRSSSKRRFVFGLRAQCRSEKSASGAPFLSTRTGNSSPARNAVGSFSE
jgi:hypothetical protein